MRKLSSLFRPQPAQRERIVHVAFVLAFLLFLPLAAHSSPFDQGISSVSDLFTGTLARAGSLIACVLGGLGFAFGDQGAKKNLAGVVFGVGIALLAANVLSWLWAA